MFLWDSADHGFYYVSPDSAELGFHSVNPINKHSNQWYHGKYINLNLGKIYPNIVHMSNFVHVWVCESVCVIECKSV